MGIAGRGQRVTVEGMNFYRLKDCRVTDIWTQFGGLTMVQQLAEGADQGHEMTDMLVKLHVSVGA